MEFPVALGLFLTIERQFLALADLAGSKVRGEIKHIKNLGAA